MIKTHTKHPRASVFHIMSQERQCLLEERTLNHTEPNLRDPMTPILP